MIQASLAGLAEYGSSPLRIQRDDIPVLIYSSLGLGLLLNSDVRLFAQLAQGDARKEWLNQSMPTVSTIGEGWSEALLVLLGYAAGNDRLSRTSGTALESLVVTAVFAEGLKLAAWSNRPSQNDQQHRFFAYDQSSQGMPSGHTFSAFALAEVYGSEYGRFIPYTLAAIIGYSRIYNQAHWPSDVFAGAGLGILAGSQAQRLAHAHGAPVLRLSATETGNTPVLSAELNF